MMVIMDYRVATWIKIAPTFEIMRKHILHRLEPYIYVI